MKKKFLMFYCWGEWFIVNEEGLITRKTKNPQFSGDWKLLGVSYHHARNGIDTPFKELFEDPAKMLNGMVWDEDHGTTRKWEGSVGGKLSRVIAAYVE